MGGRITDTGVEQYYDDELVVDLVHLGAVTNLIDAWAGTGRPAWVRRDDEAGSALLGLAWIEVAGLKAVAGTLRGRAELVARAGRHRKGPVEDLDLLLHALREERPEFVIGKHRLVENVEGTSVPRNAPAGMRLERRGPTEHPRVRVGVLGTPIWPHDQLAGRFMADSDALLPRVREAPTPMLAGHATFVAGIIAAHAPDAELVVRAGLDEGAVCADSWEVATRMVGFGAEEVDLLQLSFACFTADDEPPLVVERAVARLREQAVLVAAAGNHAAEPGARRHAKAFPAACEGVVAVGTEAEFSPKAPWVALHAPGTGVTSTYLEGRVSLPKGEEAHYCGAATWSGTSFAAAAVSGAIAGLAHRRGSSAREAKEYLLHRPEVRDIHPPEAVKEDVSAAPAPPPYR
ncbi:S8 family serine peptidase [Nonomuraea sp. NPDC050790]|uniref:S8 family serine peptidase n=1 Tax=Nonomuraea sp. NPDC050790 TaxID=3364371 RepID=UPI0037A9711A